MIVVYRGGAQRVLEVVNAIHTREGRRVNCRRSYTFLVTASKSLLIAGLLQIELLLDISNILQKKLL